MKSRTRNRFGWFDLLSEAGGDGTEECQLSNKLGPSSASEPANAFINLLIGLEQTHMKTGVGSMLSKGKNTKIDADKLY